MPRMEIGLITYSFLAAFSSLSHFPTPLPVFLGITFQILLAFTSLPLGKPQTRHLYILVGTISIQTLNYILWQIWKENPLLTPFNINSIVCVSCEVPQGQFEKSGVLCPSLDGEVVTSVWRMHLS